MKNAVFWGMALCGSCKNRRFGGSCRLRLQGRNDPQFANTFICSETSVLIRPTRCHIAEGGIHHLY
jgi:hypothetical protein